MLFKIRPSAAGKIMTGNIGLTEKQQDKYLLLLDKEKRTDNQEKELQLLIDKKFNPEIPQTLKSYCEQWYKEKIYNKKYEFSSKYTEKGLIQEDENIDIIADYLNKGMLIKNDKTFENDFIIGTPDIILPNEIIDLKSSWDCFTFPLFDDEIPNMDYYWQLQSYMDLTGKEKARLIYVLGNTPMHIIEREAYFYCKNNGYDELDMDILKSFVDKMTYSNIDLKYRIKEYNILRNDSDIKLIHERVDLCREYIKTLKVKYI